MKRNVQLAQKAEISVDTVDTDPRRHIGLRGIRGQKRCREQRRMS